MLDDGGEEHNRFVLFLDSPSVQLVLFWKFDSWTPHCSGDDHAGVLTEGKCKTNEHPCRLRRVYTYTTPLNHESDLLGRAARLVAGDPRRRFSGIPPSLTAGPTLNVTLPPLNASSLQLIEWVRGYAIIDPLGNAKNHKRSRRWREALRMKNLSILPLTMLTLVFQI